mmetsp:Transcript_58597/g.124364  ORF Transcript_58597/g.124364 Transcript_58597/m.124364 type:complete len:245 (+) Transcript_58597:1665-2399(+)
MAVGTVDEGDALLLLSRPRIRVGFLVRLIIAVGIFRVRVPPRCAPRRSIIFLFFLRWFLVAPLIIQWQMFVAIAPPFIVAGILLILTLLAHIGDLLPRAINGEQQISINLVIAEMSLFRLQRILGALARAERADVVIHRGGGGRRFAERNAAEAVAAEQPLREGRLLRKLRFGHCPPPPLVLSTSAHVTAAATTGGLSPRLSLFFFDATNVVRLLRCDDRCVEGGRHGVFSRLALGLRPLRRHG